ncbi:MAG: hypothetical protein ACREYC_20325 [Gammaproteobacteria bacterium]
MPRPKPSKALPSFYSRGHKLSDRARNKLIELLGYGKVDLFEESVRHQLPGMKILERKPGAPLRLTRDPNPQAPAPGKDVGKIILDIETALGIYVDGYQHLDDVPRPADYVAIFEPIYRDATKLLNTVGQLHGYYSEQLRLKGVIPHKIAQELASLVDAANAVVKDFENRSSKRAPKKNALTATIRKLRCIFRDHYEGPRDDRRRRGAWELEFVEVALGDLRDAAIIAEGAWDAAIAEGVDLPRLFRDPRSVPQKKKGARAAGLLTSDIPSP